jgi:hypothetical protein
MNRLQNWDLIKRTYKSFVCKLTKLSPKLASKLIYRVATGKKLDLRNPKDFNQKIMWLKLNTYYNNPLVTMCADKYAVRNFIIQRGCEDCLNDLIAVYDNVSEILWEELPNQFVLKCNHGCGYNIICTDKEKLDSSKVLHQINCWMNEDYWLFHAEVKYKFIPQKIVCERFLKSKENCLPNDYKIYCFNGEPTAILVCYDRESKLKLLFFDVNWLEIEIGKSNSADNYSTIKKPASLEQMLKISKKLSDGLPFVRIDFYDINGVAIFGEMTFTPAGGLANYYSDYGLKWLGDKLTIPRHKRILRF